MRTAWVLLGVNICTLLVGLFVLEFEYAKFTHPTVLFLSTPRAADTILGSAIVLGSILNTALLTFVIRRNLLEHLWNLCWSTAAVLALTLGIKLILGSAFLPVLWP